MGAAMSLTRRNFLLNTTYVGAGLAVTGGINPLMAHATTEPVDLTPHLTGIRMAATPATDYRAYRSKVVASPDVTTWIQVDLGESFPIEAIQLFPASERMYPGLDRY
jgi:hypothetical protein